MVCENVPKPMQIRINVNKNLLIRLTIKGALDKKVKNIAIFLKLYPEA